MARHVFFSFHYKPDSSRAGQVRNAGVVDGNVPVSDNDWEAVTKKGDKAIEDWIARQMKGRSCTVVLVGTNTTGRKWINYEIKQSWAEGMGLLGIYIHNLKDLNGWQSAKGSNPFADFAVGKDKTPLTKYAKTYAAASMTSKEAYKYITDNIADWVEAAIKARNEA